MTKDEALKMAIEALEKSVGNIVTYETGCGGNKCREPYCADCSFEAEEAVARNKLLVEKVNKTINACKEALEQPDKYVFVCKHCGDELGLEWSEDTIGQITINPKEDPDATDNT